MSYNLYRQQAACWNARIHTHIHTQSAFFFFVSAFVSFLVDGLCSAARTTEGIRALWAQFGTGGPGGFLYACDTATPAGPGKANAKI